MKYTPLRHPANKIPYPEFPIELEQRLSNIEKLLGHRGFGLTVGEEIHPSDYSTLGYLLMNCQTLNQALEFASHYKFVLSPSFDCTLVPRESFSRYQITPNHLPLPFFETLVELDFASAVVLARFLVGRSHKKQVAIKEVGFSHAPLTNISHYQRLFGCPIKFEQASNYIDIETAVLELPIRAANQQIFNMLKRKIDRFESQTQGSSSFAQLVFQFLSSQEGKVPDISEAAQHFHISPSTFKKRLQHENLNYTRMCDQLKKKAALTLLDDPNIRIKEIYLALEFKSPSAFNRAFKRWTDQTPSAYRKQGANKQG